MKLSLYFPPDFPETGLADQSRDLDPSAHPAGYIFTLGRHPSSDIQLGLREISARHCRFRFTPPEDLGAEIGSWEIADASSTNGTYLNGVRLSKNWEPLIPQDRIALSNGSITVIVIEPFDTLQAEGDETELMPIPLSGGPRSPADFAWEVLQWVAGGQTTIARAYRLVTAAVMACLAIVLLSLLAAVL